MLYFPMLKRSSASGLPARLAVVSIIALGLSLNACTPIADEPRHVATDSKKFERPDTAIQLGMSHLRSGNKQLASENFHRAVKIAPDYPAAHAALALFQEQIGDAESADKHFRRALELKPLDGRTRNNYANFLCRQARFPEADEQFSAALQDRLYRSPELLLTNAGVCAMNIPDLGKAEIYFRKALSLNPKTPAALFQMAKISFDVGRIQSVMGFLERHWSVAGKSADSLWLAIRTQRRLGNQARASAYSRELRSSFPDAPQIEYLNQSPR